MARKSFSRATGAALPTGFPDRRARGLDDRGAHRKHRAHVDLPRLQQLHPRLGEHEWLYIGSDRDSTNLVNWEIYLLQADGSEIVRVTENIGLMDRFPSWTP